MIMLIKTQDNMRIPFRRVTARVYLCPSTESVIVSKLFLDHGSVLAPDGESPNNGSVTAWQKNASSDVFESVKIAHDVSCSILSVSECCDSHGPSPEMLDF